MNIHDVLIRHNYAIIPDISEKMATSSVLIGTVVSNLLNSGYVPSKELFSELESMGDANIKKWWGIFEKPLKSFTGESRKMENYVVYKNFPQEVLEKTAAEYWIAQICMYLGMDNHYFQQQEQMRSAMFEKVTLKVLHLANEENRREVFGSLLKNPSKWVKDQQNQVDYFLDHQYKFDLTQIPFKENMVYVAVYCVKNNIKLTVNSATDVLRIAVGYFGGDVSMKTPSKFGRYSRSSRKYFLQLLEKTTHLEEDVARDKNKWKTFLQPLHPGEFGSFFPKVASVYDKLYNNKVKSFNSGVESLIGKRDEKVLNLLKSRPGDFMRRLHQLDSIFPKKTEKVFSDIVDKFTVLQLVKIKGYLSNINSRKNLTVAPKGNWTRLQLVPNTKSRINSEGYISYINKELQKRVSKKFKSINLDPNLNRIKIQTNDSDLLPYGRGTRLPIPSKVEFIRSASYWEQKNKFNVWFDNGWNFFDSYWNDQGACSWSTPHYDRGKNRWSKRDGSRMGAIFGGDPTASKEMAGKGCQMIDLYPKTLKEMGISWGVWSILCYSGIKFKDATDVFAALQWGEEAQKGKLFEPSRCQLKFPIQGDTFTKYIIAIDFSKMEVIYLDANFKASTQSAACNGGTLATVMPSYMEYLDSLPSYHDVFDQTGSKEDGIPLLYSDADISLKGEKAWVFKPENSNNTFERIDLGSFLTK